MKYPKINRSQRDAIFNLVILELSGTDDLVIAIDREDELKAHEMRRRIEDRFRLLDDIGWRQRTHHDTFNLRMDETNLRRLLRELGEQAFEVLQFDAEELRITAERRSDDATQVLSTTTALLADLGGSGNPEPMPQPD